MNLAELKSGETKEGRFWAIGTDQETQITLRAKKVQVHENDLKTVFTNNDTITIQANKNRVRVYLSMNNHATQASWKEVAEKMLQKLKELKCVRVR